MEVGCPWARWLQPQLHPKAEEHALVYQPATQVRGPSRPFPPPPIPPLPPPPPYYSTRHTEARSPVEVKRTKPSKQTRKEGETLNQESGGRKGNQEKRCATRTPRHANKASSTTQTQRRYIACACAKATYLWTGTTTMLMNEGKHYKRKHSHATALQTANTPPKNAKITRDHCS